MKDVISTLFGSALGVLFFITSTLGWLYWMYMAVKIGSFAMFIFGILGPLAFVAGVLGLWSFFFGAPAWLLNLVN
ncbi:MAG TPA: hypothetical protein PL193_02645 [Xanthobacteraceae bacterium]|nr:hypothetical protein [Xanthobacteraceae bacterium]